MLLKDRVALVVGGGGALGRAIAQAYSREGALLAVADLRREAALETLTSSGRTADGLALTVDIAEPAACQTVVEQVVARFGRLEILVNCAAICLAEPLLEVTPEHWDKVFAINVRGAFFCMQAAAKVMIPRKYGRLLHISSPASRMGFPLFASYAASKAAVDSMIRAAAVDWARHGVTVNSLVPGRMTGGMILALEQDLARLTAKTEEELKVSRTQGLPMGAVLSLKRWRKLPSGWLRTPPPTSLRSVSISRAAWNCDNSRGKEGGRMSFVESGSVSATVHSLKVRAKELRRHVLRMAERVGQGYVGQGLGIADLLTVLYFHEMRYDAHRLDWPDRDRFVLSIGHYSIGLYAALAEAKVLPVEELDTYGADGSRLEMSGSETAPGFEMTGGSLGQGLPQAVGMALGVRFDRRPARIFCLLSDGELQEGATWEAALAGSHYRLDNLIAFIDCNNQQADGPPEKVMGVEPVDDKWVAFGWHVQRIDGNDIEAILAALEETRANRGKPHAIVLDTLMGKGVPLFERREKNHFIRVDASEWDLARKQLEESND